MRRLTSQQLCAFAVKSAPSLSSSTNTGSARFLARASSLGAFATTPLCTAVRFQTIGGTLPSSERQMRDDDRPTEASIHRQRPDLAPTDLSSSAGGGSHEAQRGYNPWDVLGLKPGVTAHDVRLRYHELLKTCHPDLDASGGDIGKLNQINKAYEIITKSPTLDKRYRNLVSDTQYVYYKFLPEWMAKNVDEMPRYWSWVKWRTPTAFLVVLWCCGFFILGRFYVAFPFFTTVFAASIVIDILLHTMIAPATFSMLFLNAMLTSQSYDMAWLTSPKGFLTRELGY